MSSNRISGLGPADPGKSDHKPVGDSARPKGTEKVEKVEEVDPDAQSKAHKFRQALQEAEEQLDNAVSTVRAPGPFETSFHTEGKKPLLGGFKQPSVPQPSTSPPPNVAAAPPPPPSFTPEPEEDLPHADNFWNNVDASSEPPPPEQQLQETPQSSQRSFSSQEDEKTESPSAPQKKESAPGSQPSKPAKGKPAGKKEPLADDSDETAAMPHAKGKKSSPFAHAADKQETDEPSAAPPLGQTADTKATTLSSTSSSVKPLTEQERQIAQMHTSARRERERGDREREKRPIEIEGPSLPPLPPEIAPLAQAAATQAAPYLSQQAASLFYQMVGTILILAREPGVSRTEILLNAPSFANSRFFGSTILIEKYAIAPDAVNIRLSGSNEAVASFNQNIASLMAAFQNGKFSFRVNRIDAVYATDKPVFRRKEPGRGSGGSGGLGG